MELSNDKMQMKLIFFIISLIFFQSLLFGQKTKTVTIKFPQSNQVSECYSVLKSNPNIKHGTYISYFHVSEYEQKQIKAKNISIYDFARDSGNYVNGLKDGSRIEFPSIFKKNVGSYKNGKKVMIWSTFIGKYKVSNFDYDENKKVGIWITFIEDGKIIERFDYDKNKSITPLLMPECQYPTSCKENGIDGIVILSYNINSDCSITNINVIKSVTVEMSDSVQAGLKRLEPLLKKHYYNCENHSDTLKFKFTLL